MLMFEKAPAFPSSPSENLAVFFGFKLSGENQVNAYRVITGNHVIDTLDLNVVIDDLIAIKQLNEDSRNLTAKVKKLSEQYKAFLYLNLKYPEEVLVPFPELDEFWHCHILHTKKYLDDCNAVFGYYLHHQPHRQKSLVDRQFYLTQYQRTCELVIREFPSID